jgi:SIT family siderophore-iron:H+ symporter-like MFS transporter
MLISSADVFGRVEVVLVSIFFYILGETDGTNFSAVVLIVTGTIIEAVSHDVESFSAGAVFYQVSFIQYSSTTY